MKDEKREILKSFENKLKSRLDKDTLNKLFSGDFDDDLKTVDYEQFRSETLAKNWGFFEKACNFAERMFPLAPDKKTKERIEGELEIAHLKCSATGVQSLTILVSGLIVLLGLFIFMFLQSSTIGFGIVLVGFVAYFIMLNLTKMLANNYMSKAQDQIVLAVFYIVAYMRFNSNFELAINFAAHYLGPPLSLDFKRLLWQLDNAEYPSLKVAFDSYLERWRDDNLEFLEAIYLVESSLYESEDFRRISLLDKSLDIILQGNYEKILNFAQVLREKVQFFNMIGVVLPVLGLIILPLAASFGNPKSVWEVVLILYDILFPAFVAYFGFTIIFNKPAGANSIKVNKRIKDIDKLQKYKMNFFGKPVFLDAKVPAITIFVLFLFIGLIPIFVHALGDEIEGKCTTTLESSISQSFAGSFSPSSPFGTFQEYKFIDKGEGYCYGPYGLYPGLLSVFLPMSLAFGIGYYFRIRYKNLIHMRDKTKQLEKQFPSAAFQLGNRINEGMSAEIAFGAVAETMRGTEASNFFGAIDTNIKFNGMSIEKAIFDEHEGAINNYPSDIITSSMKIYVKASEKGPEIAAKTLIDLSRYLNEIHLAQERLKDLLAESLGSMKSQASFLAPVISGVVIAIVSLVTLIMGKLSEATNRLAEDSSAGISGASFLGESIPTFLFQSVVGIYVVFLIIILVYMVTNLENGDDPINTKYQIGEKLIGGMMKYSLIVVLGIIGFSYMGATVLSGLV